MNGFLGFMVGVSIILAMYSGRQIQAARHLRSDAGYLLGVGMFAASGGIGVLALYLMENLA